MKKILLSLGFVFMILFSLSSVYSAVLNDSRFYYSFDTGNITSNTMIDLAGNFNGTCSNIPNCNPVQGVLRNATQFVDTDDRINNGYTDSTSTTATINFWFKSDATVITSDEYLFRLYSSGNDFITVRREADDEDFYFMVRDGGTYFADTNVIDGNNVDIHFISMTFNGSTCQVYHNATLVLTDTTCKNFADVVITDTVIGSYAVSLRYAGWIDEFSLYNRTLTQPEIAELYNSSNGYNPYLVGAAPLSPTPQITSNITNGAFYNTTTITGTANTTSNVNMTYSLDNTADVTICNTCNTSTFTIPDISTTVYNSTSFSSVTGNITLNIDDAIKASSIVTSTTNQLILYNFSFNDNRQFTINGGQSVNFLNWLNFSTTNFVINTSQLINASGHLAYGNYSYTTIGNLGEGSHNLSLKSVDGSGTNYNNLSFTIDITKPTLSVANYTEYNTNYTFNFSSIINYSDTNLDSCTVSIDTGDIIQCTNYSYLFSLNGNHSFNVSVNDSAGNYQHSRNNILYLNPYQYFYFVDNASNPVVNFTINGVSYTNFYRETIYDIGLGSQTLQFEKAGYQALNFTRVFNTSSAYNETISLSPTLIIITIYDRLDGSLLTGENVTVTLVGDAGQVNYTTTGYVNLSGLLVPNGEYQIVASSANYETEQKYFTFSSIDTVSLDIYMLNSTQANAGVITITVKDTLTNFIEDATVNLLEWKPTLSSYLTVAQCSTNANGVCDLNIELDDKLYKFSATKSGVSTTTNSQIITATGTGLTIVLGQQVLITDPDLSQVYTNFTNISLVNNVTTVRFEFKSLDGTNVKGCITPYRDTGFSKQKLAAANCSTTTDGILYYTATVNNTYLLSLEATIEYDSVTYKAGIERYEAIDAISKSLRAYSLDIILPPVMVLVGLGIGLLFGSIAVSIISMVILIWLSFAIVPTVITSTAAVSLSVIGGLILWGIYRR